MKISTKLLTLLTVFAFVAASCGNDDEPDPSNTNNNGGGSDDFSVTVDGAAWADITATAIKNSVGRIIVTGVKGDESISITMPDNVTAGTYDLVFMSDYNATYKPSPLGDPLTSSSGKLTISKHETSSNEIAGTFNFSATGATGGSGSKTITNGSFNLKYTEQ